MQGGWSGWPVPHPVGSLTGSHTSVQSPLNTSAPSGEITVETGTADFTTASASFAPLVPSERVSSPAERSLACVQMFYGCVRAGMGDRSQGATFLRGIKGLINVMPRSTGVSLCYPKEIKGFPVTAVMQNDGRVRPGSPERSQTSSFIPFHHECVSSALTLSHLHHIRPCWALGARQQTLVQVLPLSGGW